MITKRIRKAIIHDLPLLLSWGKKMYEVEKTFIPLLNYSPTEANHRYTNQITDPNFLFIIALLEQKPVGYLYAHLDIIEYLNTKKPQCEIEVIFLDEKARSSGLAQELIKTAINWAKENNAFEVKAGIFVKNLASQLAFKKTGFVPQHTTYILEI